MGSTWHWPVMILAGYEYGNEYIGAPVLGPVVFCIAAIVMGVLLDFVYEKTQCIWIPALMHGAVNAFTIFSFLLKSEYMNRIILEPMYIGIISMIPMILMVIFISWKTETAKQENQ